MKENEAPEKIYLIRNISTSTSLNTTNDCHEKYLQEWYKEREKEADVEYTRTDTFIDKACDYLQKNLWRIILEENEFRQRFITDFKKYIKGE